MSIDVINETDFVCDELEIRDVAAYVLAQLHVYPQAELAITMVDEAAMETLHV